MFEESKYYNVKFLPTRGFSFLKFKMIDSSADHLSVEY